MGEGVKYTVGIIIISDRAASGERADGCLPVFEEILPEDTYEITGRAIISDDPAMILEKLSEYIEKDYNLILTSGGTGCAARDNTPEVSAQVIEKPTPGVDEAIRHFSQSKAPFAIYSRAISGVAKKSFVINLPGSPNAVREILTFLLPTLPHPLKLIAGKVKDCGLEAGR